MLKQIQGNVDENFDYEKTRKETENMFKKETFDKDYIQKFKNFSTNNKYLETPKYKLIQRKDELQRGRIIQKKDQEEIENINNYLRLLETSFIENTKSRDIHLDPKAFENQPNKFNSQCFFEQDAQGNKNYFSINELLNDLETFGVES
jgi:hypothetical protein